jgi:hypothetical protein
MADRNRFGVARRKTAVLVEPPYALTPAFAEDPTKRQQWLSFAESIDAKVPALAIVVAELAAFLMPHAAKARAAETVAE